MAETHVIGHADRNAVNLILSEPDPVSPGYYMVVQIISHSMRDPAARKGPSYRPDFGRSYRGEPKA